MDYSSNVSVNGPACSYATLNHYNKTMKGSGFLPPQPTNVTGTYIVPDWGMNYGYNSLTRGDAPSCAGYFNIQGAYGKNANNCSTQFKTRSCNN